MQNDLSAELKRMVHQRLESGMYASEEEVLYEAMQALDDLERRHAELQQEIQRRLGRSTTSDSAPLDRDAFRKEARQRFTAPLGE